MPRRLGASVPSTVSRLLQGGLLPAPPAWFSAVGTVAPLRPSLTRKVPRQLQDPVPQASTSQNGNDDYAWHGNRRLSSAKSKKSMKYRPAKPAPVKGLELQDRVRRMFYEDHPFEAFRGTNLVEHEGVKLDEESIGPNGLEWQELRQRSFNPSPEDCVAFILNLHTSHSIPLALAYQSGVSQFRSLRASYEISLHAAQVELESHGFRWPTEFSSIDRLTRAEDRNIMDVLKDKNRPGASSITAPGGIEAGPSSASQLLNPVGTTTRSWSGGLDYLAGKKQIAGHVEDVRNTARRVSGESTPEDPHGLGISDTKEVRARKQSERKSDVSQLPTETGRNSAQEGTLPTGPTG